MHTVRGRRTLWVVGFGALALFGTACSNGAEPAATSTGTSATVAGTSTTAGSANDRCTVEVLTPVVQAQHAGAVLADLTCGPRTAIASVAAADLGGDGIAFFQLGSGGWKLLAAGPLSAGADALRPKDVSASQLSSWESTRQRRIDPASATSTTTRTGAGSGGGGAAGAGGVGGVGGGGGAGGLAGGGVDCVGEGADQVCTTTTLPPPPTTTTTAPTTTTTAKPAETTTTRPPISAWCKEPSHALTQPCLSDPSYPGP